MKQYDIAIVGGGLVGATLASALSRLPYSVIVLEAFALGDASQPSFDDRSVALSYGSRLLMQNMGLWACLKDHAQPISEIQISEQKRLGLTRMQAQEEGVDALGYVIENRIIGEQLGKHIEDADALQWLAPATVTEVETHNESVELTYESGGEVGKLQTRLLIAADGAQSFARDALGIQVDQQDYGLSAIIANVQTQLPHKGIAYERFTKTGPLAFLPLSPHQYKSRSSVVLTVKHDEVDELMAMEEGAFLKELQERFGQRLGRLQKAGKRAAYPVALTEAQRCTAQRSVVIGNAAQSLNPVAGQGFNLALRDVADLLELLKRQASSGIETDPGAVDLLETYTSNRKQDRKSTIFFTDALVKVFSNSITPLAHARAGGLLAADLLEPLRQQLVRQGMGLKAKRRIKGFGL